MVVGLVCGLVAGVAWSFVLLGGVHGVRVRQLFRSLERGQGDNRTVDVPSGSVAPVCLTGKLTRGSVVGKVRKV